MIFEELELLKHKKLLRKKLSKLLDQIHSPAIDSNSLILDFLYFSRIFSNSGKPNMLSNKQVYCQMHGEREWELSSKTPCTRKGTLKGGCIRCPPEVLINLYHLNCADVFSTHSFKITPTLKIQLQCILSKPFAAILKLCLYPGVYLKQTFITFNTAIWT